MHSISMNCVLANAHWRKWAKNPFAIAFAISLAIHIVMYFSYGEIKKLNWKGQAHFLQSLFPTTRTRLRINPLDYIPFSQKKPTFLQLKKAQPEQAQKLKEEEPPLLFVSVAPFQAVSEPPEKPKFYSDKNSVAANPRVDKITDIPKIDGTQDKVMQTVDVPKPDKPAPQLPKPEPKGEEKKVVEQKPPEPEPLKPSPQIKQPEPLKPSPPPQVVKKTDTFGDNKPVEQKPQGDTESAKPVKESGKSEGSPNVVPGIVENSANAAPQPRPRTLAEALARQAGSGLTAGQKYRQEGGVKRMMEFSAVDAKATPFGAYDASVFYAIQKRWYDLLDNARFSGDRRGKVVIDFRLHYDGRVSNLTIVESTVGEFLTTICRMAIEDPAPFERWPADMRRMVGQDYREVRITFYYL